VELAVPNWEAHHLWWDFEIISAMAKVRFIGIFMVRIFLLKVKWLLMLFILRIKLLIRSDSEKKRKHCFFTIRTLLEARKISQEFFRQCNSSAEKNHMITAVGHW
jgi:hypothetical protein